MGIFAWYEGLDIDNGTGINQALYLVFEFVKVYAIAAPLWELIKIAAERTRLEIDRHDFRYQVSVLGWRKGEVQFRTENIKCLKVGPITKTKKSHNSHPFILVEQKSKRRVLLWLKSQYFGFGYLLAKRETEWLVGEIGDFLTNRRDAEGAEGS